MRSEVGLRTHWCDNARPRLVSPRSIMKLPMSSPVRLPRVRAACALALPCFLLFGIAHAANLLGLVRPESTAAATATPEVIQPGDIPLRADIDERFVQDVRLRALQHDPSDELQPQLEQLANGIVTLSRTLKKEELQELSAIRLQSLENHWKFYDRQLADWRKELERVTASYSEDAAALAKRRVTWEATQSSMDVNAVNAALSNRVALILDQLTQAEQALSGPLDHQIQLRRRANSVQASIDAGLKGMDGAIAYYDRRLTTIDARPVWEAWRDTHFTRAGLAGTMTGLRFESQFLREWTAPNLHRIRGYEAAVIVLLPLMLYLSIRSRKIVVTEPGMQAAVKVLRRPVSAWLVLSLIVLPFAFPEAPLVLHQVAFLVAMIPVLRLLPAKVFHVLGSWPYFGTLLFVLYRLSFPVLDDQLYFRLYILAVAALALVIILWLLVSRRGLPPTADTAPARGYARMLGWLAIAALFVAIGANVVGNVSLAEMLTSAVLDSTYIGLALYAGAAVVASILNLALARRSVTRLRVITQHAGPLLASTTKLIKLAALVIWLVVVLGKLRISRPVVAWLRSVLTYPLEAGQISVTLGNILLFVFSVWVAFWVARTMRFLLRDEVLPKMALPRGVGNSISTLSYYTVVVIGLLVALAASGFETSQFAIIFGALSVGIGFGLQNVVNNFVSGLILMFERPIQPGDVVEVSGTSGRVRSIGMRATTLTTFEGADVVVPNGTLLSEKLINWTLSDMTRRVDVEVGVAYGSDPRHVLALLTEIAAGTPGISQDPAPAVLFMRFGANALEFSIRAWTGDFNNWVTIRTEMTTRVYEALRREGIEIPFPQHDLHLRSVPPDAGAQLGAAALPLSSPEGGP